MRWYYCIISEDQGKHYLSIQNDESMHTFLIVQSSVPHFTSLSRKVSTTPRQVITKPRLNKIQPEYAPKICDYCEGSGN